MHFYILRAFILNLSIHQERPNEDTSSYFYDHRSTRLAFDNSSNLPSASPGCAQLHITSFWLQEGFLHNNAGFLSTEHLLPVCVQTRLVGTGTMAGTNHWSSDPCCHLIDECKTVRCLGEQVYLCIAASVIETLKYADVSRLIGAPERYRSLHVSGHVCVPTRSILVALEM